MEGFIVGWWMVQTLPLHSLLVMGDVVVSELPPIISGDECINKL